MATALRTAPLDDTAFLDAFKVRRVKDGKNLTNLLKDAIVEAELEMTIEGAGTLTLTINDPDWIILESGVFDRTPPDQRLDAIDLKVDHRWYRLMAVAVQGSTLTLTCEEREVVYLRAHRRVKGKDKWRRSEHTRAEFARKLVLSVKAGGGITFYALELHKKQPVVAVSRTDRQSDSGSPHGGKHKIGRFASTAYGPPWDSMNGSGVTANGTDLRPAKKKYGIAIDPDSALSLDKNYYVWPNPFDYDGTFEAFDTGGAIQNNRIDFYDWRGRQEQLAWGRKDVTVYRAGGAKHGSSDDSSGRIKPYAYKVNNGETFWDAIQRLAQEDVTVNGVTKPLGWRGFLQNYKQRNKKLGVRFVFAAEEDLLKRGKSRFTLDREDARVVDFSFSWDQGKKTSEAALTLFCERWAVDPGEVIQLRGAGPANGRWLVSSIRRSLFKPTADITLKQPMPEQKEPAPQVESVDSEGNATSGGGSGKRGHIGGQTSGLTANLKDFLHEVAGNTDEEISIFSGLRPGDVGSTHASGNGADIDAGGDARSSTSAASKGDNIATAVMMTLGMSRNEARSYARSGRMDFSENHTWNGLTIETGWRTLEGGNHYNHVHVGIEGQATSQLSGPVIQHRTGGS